MKREGSLAAVVIMCAALLLGLGTAPGSAQSRAHVYLFRGLADIFSHGMDVLADELNSHGVYATSHSHDEWKALADRAAADYKAGKEGPIILIGHSLGADSVMEMADYLGDKGVPVALLVPFDATQSFAASANVSRVLNLTQRDYAYMRAGPGFRGSLVNMDVSSDTSIDHLNIDKTPRLHARVIAEVLAVTGGHRLPGPPEAVPAADASTAQDKPAKTTEAPKPKPGATAIALPEARGPALVASPAVAPPAISAPVPTVPAVPAPQPRPAPPERPAAALQIPD
jgi:hypothetical protein